MTLVDKYLRVKRSHSEKETIPAAVVLFRFWQRSLKRTQSILMQMLPHIAEIHCALRLIIKIRDVNEALTQRKKMNHNWSHCFSTGLQELTQMAALLFSRTNSLSTRVCALTPLIIRQEDFKVVYRALVIKLRLFKTMRLVVAQWISQGCLVTRCFPLQTTTCSWALRSLNNSHF